MQKEESIKRYQAILNREFDKLIIHENGTISVRILPAERDIPIISDLAYNEKSKLLKITFSDSEKGETLLANEDISILMNKARHVSEVTIQFKDGNALMKTLTEQIDKEKREISNLENLPALVAHHLNKRTYQFCMKVAKDTKAFLVKNSIDTQSV